MMQFNSFNWFSHTVYEQLYRLAYALFYWSVFILFLFFYILVAFLTKELFHSRLLDMR